MFVFSCFSHSFGLTYDCRRFSAMFVCRCRDAAIVYVRAIRTSKVYLISNNKSNQWLLILICCRYEIIGILVTIIISSVHIQLSNI